MDVDFEDLYIGRWFEVINWIERLSKMTDVQRKESKWQQYREELYRSTRLFGSETLYIFCSDSKDDLFDELIKGRKIQDAIDDPKHKLIHVNYHELSDFRYDEKMYSDILIIDNFMDLI